MNLSRIEYAISIKANCGIELADKFLKEIKSEKELLLGVGWDYIIADNSVVFIGYGYEEGYYDPGCRYTSNGDGWPESFDVVDGDYCEDDLDEFIRHFQEENPDFVIIKRSVTQ